MLRKTLTILSLIGLLLSVGLWGVSYWEPRYRVTDESTLWASKGRLFLSNHGLEVVFAVKVEIEKWRGFQGFETEWLPHYYEHIQLPYWNLGIPLWMPTLLFLAIFWLSLLPFYRRRKRKKLGLCLKCGYDLRASKDRCPECGEKFHKRNYVGGSMGVDNDSRAEWRRGIKYAIFLLLIIPVAGMVIYSAKLKSELLEVKSELAELKSQEQRVATERMSDDVAEALEHGIVSLAMRSPLKQPTEQTWSRPTPMSFEPWEFAREQAGAVEDVEDVELRFRRDCCFAHTSEGCTDPNCQSIVCGIDTTCCSGLWSQNCAELAVDNCEQCFP